MTVTLKPQGSDLFTSQAEAFINPVNCVGAMGAGLALVFKNRFPENYRVYRSACDRRELKPGGMITFSDPNPGPGRPVYIVNLATKNHWKDDSELSWVASGAQEVCVWAEENGVRSVACPALGSGLGGLDWDLVLPVLLSAFEKSNVHFEVFSPGADPRKKPDVRAPDAPLSSSVDDQSPRSDLPQAPAAARKAIVFRKRPA